MTVNQLKSYFGKNRQIADFYGITLEAIYMWRKRSGQIIPKSRALEAEYRTNGALKFDPSFYAKKNNDLTKI
ncbi:Cro/CI family transcriptional regulator [Arsenophonus nasoniae]|uniref:DNA-binding transcriptional regulator Cro n=1 Tax=Arsenophonus nasoniae TaxID=638 RepID=D2TX38_9GAMM|nr:Cro/CI family transcriptional regulator [Arsenophonus nasoniae]QBY42520.1 DNA-binding transcriptional regulator Cro [Arsenophonus nasoniae]WGM11569.1 Cro/CI family transcriptional regulator [Arsenophonus nasoniae]WGM16264.1 Cro/CI family transcriptional regulator [Arsenophonus nasoniae]CBA71945.1 putative cell division control protein [Arsenophonus nasoniae]